jgi:hypothetical protein
VNDFPEEAMNRINKTLSLTAMCIAAVMLGGADGGCTITITPIEECTDLDEVCPNLQCEVFATNDEGCPICECEDPPPPEGCLDDSDCREGEYCSFDYPMPGPMPEPTDPVDGDGSDGAEPPSDDGDADEAAPMPPEDELIYPYYGQCVPYPDSCDDGTEPLCDMIPPVCDDGTVLAVQNFCWTCVDPNTCEEPPPPLTCANVDCAPGYTCEETPDGPICVPDGDVCYSNDDCGPGQRCEITDGCAPCTDPNGLCDAACLLEGRCVEVENCDDGGPVFCDMIPPICEDGLIAAAQNGCYECVDPDTCEPPPPPLTCANVLCAPGTVCIETSDGPQCVEQGPECFEDSDCGEGSHCEVQTYCPPCVDEEPACAAPCYIEGFCVEDEPVGCYGDDGCAEGERCNAAEICLPPPGCEDGLDCPAVCYGFCEAP